MIRPVGDRVAVVRDEVEAVTPGGVIVPEYSRERVLTGTVVALGTGGRDEDGRPVPFHVAVGDRVQFEDFSGTDYVRDGVRYLIINCRDLLGVVSD